MSIDLRERPIRTGAGSAARRQTAWSRRPAAGPTGRGAQAARLRRRRVFAGVVDVVGTRGDDARGLTLAFGMQSLLLLHPLDVGLGDGGPIHGQGAASGHGSTFPTTPGRLTAYFAVL
jgi:hypothetical protein